MVKTLISKLKKLTGTIISWYDRRVLKDFESYVYTRWFINIFLMAFFVYRVSILQRFYLVAYGLGLCLLNKLNLVITILYANNLISESNSNSYELLESSGYSLVEIKSWNYVFLSLVLALVLTLFQVFDVYIAWSILSLCLALIVFGITFRNFYILYRFHFANKMSTII